MIEQSQPIHVDMSRVEVLVKTIGKPIDESHGPTAVRIRYGTYVTEKHPLKEGKAEFDVVAKATAVDFYSASDELLYQHPISGLKPRDRLCFEFDYTGGRER